MRNSASQKALKARKTNMETTGIFKIKPLICLINSCNKILACYRQREVGKTVISFTSRRNIKNTVTHSK